MSSQASSIILMNHKEMQKIVLSLVFIVELEQNGFKVLVSLPFDKIPV